MSAVREWATRAPGRPYLWLLDLDREAVARRCPDHGTQTNRLGVCDECVSAWRARLGADPDSWAVCAACGMPVHPAVEADGFDTCPTCTPDRAAS